MFHVRDPYTGKKEEEGEVEMLASLIKFVVAVKY
jgi:hypothetical protein